MDTSTNVAVTRILDEEEHNGQLTTNRVRYVFAFVFLVGAMAVARTPFQFIINPLLFLGYLSVTVAQTVVNRRAGSRTRRAMQIVSVVFDFLLVTAMLLVYQYSEAPGNFAYSVKNLAVAAYFPVLGLTALQFRRSAVIMGIVLAMALYLGFIVVGLATGMPLTESWYEFVLGEAVVLPAALVLVPASLLCLGVVVVYLLQRSDRMLRRIAKSEAEKSSLARYFSPAVAEEISNKIDAPRFGGRQEAVVLFSDIRGFTHISELMEPEALAQFLGEFRERMLRAIFNNGGTLDKFIGDAVMATFGTPVPGEDVRLHSREAVNAARAMLGELDELNKEWTASGRDPLRIGIGIHSGEVFAGSIGSDNQLEYTCIGDTVNVAARLESLSKQVAAPVIVSQAVVDAVGDAVSARYIDRLQVRGRDEPVGVYVLSSVGEWAEAT